jgi:hypothetical protein
VWAKVNGLFSPVVLRDGWIVAPWKLVSLGRSLTLDPTMLDPHPRIPEDEFDQSVLNRRDGT